MPAPVTERRIGLGQRLLELLGCELLECRDDFFGGGIDRFNRPAAGGHGRGAHSCLLGFHEVYTGIHAGPWSIPFLFSYKERASLSSRAKRGICFGVPRCARVHSPNRTRLVSCSCPVGRVNDSYNSGRRALSQRLPDDVGRTDASRSATTMSSPNARDSAMTSP